MLLNKSQTRTKQNQSFGKMLAYTLILLVFFACQNPNANNPAPNEQSTTSATDKIPSVEVVQPVKRKFDATIQITGTAKPDKKVSIRAMANGYLKQINVDIGSYVKKGQTIAQLQNPLLSAKQTEAEIKIKELEAEIKNAEAILPSYQNIESAKKQLVQKYQTALKKNLVSEIEVTKAIAELNQATAQTASAKMTIETNKSKLQAARSRKTAASQEVSFLSVKAPFSGIVTQRFVDEGATIQSAMEQSGAMPLVSIQKINPIRLSIPLPESDASHLNVGTPVEVVFPVLGGSPIRAKINRIARSLDGSSRTMEVQADIPNPDGKIKPGMYAKATIDLGSTAKEALALPQATVTILKDVPYILIVKDGIVQKIKLQKGLSGKDFFEVLNDGIDATTQVILKGKNLVSEGQKVNPVIRN